MSEQVITAIIVTLGLIAAVIVQWFGPDNLA